MGEKSCVSKANRFEKIGVLFFIVFFVLSVFEYFFRGNLMLPACALAILVGVFIPSNLKPKNIEITLFIILNIFVCLIQCLIQPEVNFYYPFTQLFIFIAYLSVASMVRCKLLSCFIDAMTLITIVSLVFYLISFIPPVHDYLVGTIAPRCVSIGAETAAQEGGGINVIIYNFQYDSVNLFLGNIRNCGPFWEPGMFALFLNISIFINVFLMEGSRIRTLLFVVALITTVSTGGYVGGIVVLLSYLLIKRKNPIYFVLILALALFLIPYMAELEFIGDKIQEQLTHADKGEDSSRFGAFLTYIDIILDNPVFGYVGYEGYVKEDSGLASGTLIPMAKYGVFLGLFYYLLLYKSSVKWALFYGKKKIHGFLFFILLMVLSISQTFLLSPYTFVFIFAGLLINRKYNAEFNSIS